MRQRVQTVSRLLLSGTLAAVGLLAAPLCGAEPLPIARLAGVTFRVGDLEKARQFYGGAMGFEEALGDEDAPSQSLPLSFKVNDDQLLVFLRGDGDDGKIHLDRVSLSTPDVQRARKMLLERNVAAGEIRTDADGNQHFSFVDPDETAFEFVQITPNSLDSKSRG